MSLFALMPADYFYALFAPALRASGGGPVSPPGIIGQDYACANICI